MDHSDFGILQKFRARRHQALQASRLGLLANVLDP